MKSLFQPIRLGGIDSANRFVRSATFECPADKSNRFLHAIQPVYNRLAEGGVGVIITGMMGVDENSRVLPSMIDVRNRNFPEQMRSLCDSVHERGAKIVVQLSHCGVRAGCVDGGLPPLGPSDVDLPGGGRSRAMTERQMGELAGRFAEAALLCREAGADGVQMHAAHGYLFSQFLSPLFNKRDDSYGGDVAGRANFLFDVYAAMRRLAGADFPLWIKINGTDLVEGGLTPDESLRVCGELSRRGLDAIEVSGGIGFDAASRSTQSVRTEADEGRFVAEARAIADEVEIPVISVCGHRRPEALRQLLRKTRIAAFSLSRPLICEPELLRRWHAGAEEGAKCISCNKCMRPQKDLRCVEFNATAQ